MYVAHYGFTGRPFQLSPDPRFFFNSRTHKRAMAYLTYGLNQGEGFIVITGEVGAGKTTLVGHLFEQLDRDRYAAAHLVSSQLEADDLLYMIAVAFGLPAEEATKAARLHQIEAYLQDVHRQGHRALLIVNEAQNLPLSAIEELRMLSNFQQDNYPLLQCFLLGQPKFRQVLADERMEQLRQRVIASCHLEPLDENETRSYIEHRLMLVGWNGYPRITAGAFHHIHAYSDGVPRRINSLCARIFLYGFLEDKHRLDVACVAEVVREMVEEGIQQPMPRPPGRQRPRSKQRQSWPSAADQATPAENGRPSADELRDGLAPGGMVPEEIAGE